VKESGHDRSHVSKIGSTTVSFAEIRLVFELRWKQQLRQAVQKYKYIRHIPVPYLLLAHPVWQDDVGNNDRQDHHDERAHLLSFLSSMYSGCVRRRYYFCTVLVERGRPPKNESSACSSRSAPDKKVNHTIHTYVQYSTVQYPTMYRSRTTDCFFATSNRRDEAGSQQYKYQSTRRADGLNGAETIRKYIVPQSILRKYKVTERQAAHSTRRLDDSRLHVRPFLLFFLHTPVR
jgi:hypothetical protein